MNNSLPFQSYDPSQSSCDSLSTVTITLEQDELVDSSYITWHILISLFTPSIDWVYVGEVRFLGMNVPSPGIHIMYARINIYMECPS